MRQYTKRRFSPAQLDAMREGRDSARMAREMSPAPMPREPGRLVLEVNGQRFDVELRPDRRDCRRWLAYRDGKPFAHGGLECIWRKLQNGLAPMLGGRNL